MTGRSASVAGSARAQSTAARCVAVRRCAWGPALPPACTATDWARRRRPAAPRAATARGAAPIGCESLRFASWRPLVGAATDQRLGVPGQQIGQHPNRARRVAELFATIPPARSAASTPHRARKLSPAASAAARRCWCSGAAPACRPRPASCAARRSTASGPARSPARSDPPASCPGCRRSAGTGSHSASPSARRLRWRCRPIRRPAPE